MARSTEFDYEKRGMFKRIDEYNKSNARSPFTRGRALDASFDVRQLRITDHKNLRNSSTGVFYFVVGYSKIGGPDIAPTPGVDGW